MRRFYRHLSESGVTFGLDLVEGKARLALAACNLDDSFDSNTGRDVVDAILDKSNNTLRAFGLRKRVVSFPYLGSKPKLEIFGTVIDYLADYLGERAFYRALHQLFMEGVVSDQISIAVGGQLRQKWLAISQLLDKESLNVLEELLTEEELHRAFFDYRGSVTALELKLKQFASQAIQGQILFEKKSAKQRVDRMVPRKSSESEVEVEDLKNSVEEHKPHKVAAKPVKVTIK